MIESAVDCQASALSTVRCWYKLFGFPASGAERRRGGVADTQAIDDRVRQHGSKHVACIIAQRVPRHPYGPAALPPSTHVDISSAPGAANQPMPSCFARVYGRSAHHAMTLPSASVLTGYLSKIGSVSVASCRFASSRLVSAPACGVPGVCASLLVLDPVLLVEVMHALSARELVP